MNYLFKILKVLLFAGVLTTVTSCDDMMSTSSTRYMEAEDNLLLSANDTVYSVVGILNRMQKVADKYVLMGELRADLLDVTDLTRNEIRDLNNHTVDATTSTYAQTNDFYSIINNCNYFLSRVDTTITVRGLNSFVREAHAVKAIRAWAYLQLGLNYGKARYFTKPILSVDDLKKNYPDFELRQLIDTLIAEVQTINPSSLPGLPGYGNINDVSSKYLFINARVLLGDLYLWKAGFTQQVSDYEQAAHFYSLYLSETKLTTGAPSVSWSSDTYRSYYNTWSSLFETATSNQELLSIFKLANTTYNGTVSELALLSEKNELAASKVLEQLSEDQVYCYRESATLIKYTPGDLRLRAALSPKLISNGTGGFTIDNSHKIIDKYSNQIIMVYRRALVYLRYAEAVNRAGKPSLAFGVLKYGLSPLTLTNAAYFSQAELSDAKPYVNVFKEAAFNENTGIHSRGSGHSASNTFYVIPDYTRYITLKDIAGKDSVVKSTEPLDLAAAKSDSVLFVENALCDELALETAMEGNRFHDLMRISIHRNDPAFLADKVAKKHNDNYTFYFNKLSDMKNWFIPALY
jgi:hypothetical protein